MSNDIELTDLHKLILRNAEKITQLKSRIHETVKERDQSLEKNTAWKQACAEFHSSYGALMFPGGWEAIERIATGDPSAVESAISFLECRPYFFRSGYLFQKLLRRLKKVKLSEHQKHRLQKVLDKRDAWRRDIHVRLRAQAEQGDRNAQRQLGELYLYGYKHNPDFKIDCREAFKWFSAAAEQGDTDAQQQLASRYAYGSGVSQNWAEAYFWQALAAQREMSFYGKKFYEDYRDRYAAKLTPEQKEELDERVAEWKPTVST